MAIIDEMRLGGGAIALTDEDGSATFEQVLTEADALAGAVQEACGRGDTGAVGLLAPPGIDFVRGLLATWLLGRVAVPLHHRHPLPELEHALGLSGATALLHGTDTMAVASQLATSGLAPLGLHERATRSPAPATQQGPALMLFTSGTTGRPKGVLHTHESVTAQVRSLATAWQWTTDDRIHLTLPLHHVHGLVNVLGCALHTRARCDIASSFVAESCWERLASGELTLFMAVPTIYSKLIETFDEADATTQARWSAGARRLRLMVSGSAALPSTTLVRWEQITGHTLLERYGMTETGMVLSNTLESRVAGLVGVPLPGVDVRVMGDDGAATDLDGAGELQVRSPGLFSGYWDDEQATAAAFDEGWFRTGDVVVREPGGYRILGRASIDIIKTAGEKVSALEIEDVLRTHGGIADCAVVGVPDPTWGERVCVAVTPAASGAPSIEDLRAWGKQRLASYKVPTSLVVVEDLPRNALGKVLKKRVVELFSPPS